MSYYIAPHSSPTDLSSLAVEVVLCMFAIRSTASLYIYCAVRIVVCNLQTWCAITVICALKCTHSTIKVAFWTVVLLCLFLLQKAFFAGVPTLRHCDLDAINYHIPAVLLVRMTAGYGFVTACSDCVICMQLWWCGGCVWRW